MSSAFCNQNPTRILNHVDVKPAARGGDTVAFSSPATQQQQHYDVVVVMQSPILSKLQSLSETRTKRLGPVVGHCPCNHPDPSDHRLSQFLPFWSELSELGSSGSRLATSGGLLVSPKPLQPLPAPCDMTRKRSSCTLDMSHLRGGEAVLATSQFSHDPLSL